MSSPRPRGPDDIGISYLRKGRGKRSVVIDLGRPEGVEVLRRLVAKTDVLVDNFRPGVMLSLGLDYESLAELNPRLVQASITGFGPDGPDADLASMDLIIQARSGLMAKTGFPDGPPTKAGATVGDQFPAALCALGIVAALRQRDIDGRGQSIDVSMLDGLVSMLWDEPLDLYHHQGLPDRMGNGDPRGILDTFATQDGWVALVITTDAQFQRLAREMERPDLLELGPTVPARAEHREEICKLVATWMADRTTEATLDRLPRHPGSRRCCGLGFRCIRGPSNTAPPSPGTAAPSPSIRTLPLARTGFPGQVLPGRHRPGTRRDPRSQHPCRAPRHRRASPPKKSTT